MTLEEEIRRVYEAFNERGLAAVDEFWHPDIEYHEAPDFPGAGTYRGLEAVRGRFAEYIEALGVRRADVERVVAAGDRAAWTVTLSGQSSGGVPHSHTWGYVGRFEDGRMVESRAYYDAAQAFEALDSQG